jgi:dihydrolipoamide dehydrogenase
MMHKYSAIVIGSGPAGHTCAIRLAQLGAKVAVIERDYVGGICTNWGCTPSKSMIESAKIARTVQESSQYGVNVSGYSIDFRKVAARRDEVIQRARQGVVYLLGAHGVDIYQGEAEMLAPGTVRVRKGKLDLDGTVMQYTGEEAMLEAEHVVLSTGSRPLIPDFVSLDDPFVVSSNRLISIGKLPETLTIIGGGVIGLEFATIFSNLGSKVTVVEFLDRVLATMDPEISEEITRQMNVHGVRILCHHRVVSVKDGVITAEERTTKEPVEVASQAILIAIGREPVIHKEMFDRLGIAYTAKGITVDDCLHTNIPGVWAIGDATGKSILAHVGMQQGIVCAENIMKLHGEPLRRMDYDVIPSVVYSIPEVMAIGHVPSDMAGVSTYKVPFSANLRARIEAFEDGFVKVWVKEGTLLAVQAIGHNVSEIMQELANAIALKTPIERITEIIHPHPTYSEINRSVLDFALGKPLDFYP